MNDETVNQCCSTATVKEDTHIERMENKRARLIEQLYQTEKAIKFLKDNPMTPEIEENLKAIFWY